MNDKSATRVITGPDTRWSYCNLFEPRAINGGKPKYSVSLIIPKSDKETIARIRNAMHAAYENGKDKLKNSGGVVPEFKDISNPLRDGDLEKPGDPAYANAYFLNAKSDYRPSICDANREEVTDPYKIYSGVYGRAQISFFCYSVSGNRGIACGLSKLQFLRDGEPLGYRANSFDDFSDLDEEYFL